MIVNIESKIKELDDKIVQTEECISKLDTLEI